MKDDSIVDIGRKAIAYLDKIRQEEGITEAEWGKRAFPEAKNSRVKINSLRIPRTNTGEPLRLRLGDFCAMCHALGRNPAQELLILWGQADTINPE